VVVSISRTGRPLTPQERTTLFDKYAPGDDSGRGSRLGLHFCRRIVEAHGATIAVAETPEWPSRFLLRFPS
jgi:signal transduction histidine kinase